jgi:hypothetical protein
VSPLISPSTARTVASTAAAAKPKTKESPAKRSKIERDEDTSSPADVEEEPIKQEVVEMAEEAKEVVKPAAAAASPASGRRSGLGVRRSFKSPTAPTTASPAAKPATPRQVATPAAEGKKEETDGKETRYFRVMWCKYSRKKHKTYSDGTRCPLLSVADEPCVRTRVDVHVRVCALPAHVVSARL